MLSLWCMRTLAVESSWCIFYLVFQIITYGIFFFVFFFSSDTLKCSPRFIIKEIIVECIVLRMCRSCIEAGFFSFSCVCYRDFGRSIIYPVSFESNEFFFFFTRCNDLCGIFFLNEHSH